jgi:hypothetical protein
MKPTLRRNGKHMITLAVTHILDGREVAAILAMEKYGELTDFGGDEDGVRDLGKGEAEAKVRDHLYYFGTSRLEFVSDYLGVQSDDAQERALQWGSRQVRLHWPTMDPA